MHVPARFLIGLLAGLVLAVGCFVAMLYTQLGIATNSSSWAHDILEKKIALAQAEPRPRLLIFGGSGTTFGLSAGEIERQIGIPTFNLGSHAGLGLDYILRTARQVARPGDTVLLVPEYELYLSGSTLEPHDDFVLARDGDYFRQLPLQDKIAMATRIPFKRLQKGWRNKKHPEVPARDHPPYTDGATWIDSHGDETGNPATDRPAVASGRDSRSSDLLTAVDSPNGEGFGLLRDFVQWAKAHGVKVIATWPNTIDRPEYRQPPAMKTFATIDRFWSSLDVPVAGTPQQAMFPESEFFDTNYHLTREAAVKRSAQLVPELEKLKSSLPGPTTPPAR